MASQLVFSKGATGVQGIGVSLHGRRDGTCADLSATFIPTVVQVDLGDAESLVISSHSKGRRPYTSLLLKLGLSIAVRIHNHLPQRPVVRRSRHVPGLERPPMHQCGTNKQESEDMVRACRLPHWEVVRPSYISPGCCRNLRRVARLDLSTHETSVSLLLPSLYHPENTRIESASSRCPSVTVQEVGNSMVAATGPSASV